MRYKEKRTTSTCSTPSCLITTLISTKTPRAVTQDTKMDEDDRTEEATWISLAWGMLSRGEMSAMDFLDALERVHGGDILAAWPRVLLRTEASELPCAQSPSIFPTFGCLLVIFRQSIAKDYLALHPAYLTQRCVESPDYPVNRFGSRADFPVKRRQGAQDREVHRTRERW